MTQSLTLKIKGLYTYPSDFSEVPEGALQVADNIVIDRDSIAEPRRGFGYLTHGDGVQTQFSDPSYRAKKLFYYQDKILCHYDTNLFAYHNSLTGWVNYSGTYDSPSATTPMRSAQANQNFYFTTSDGVEKLDVYNGTPAVGGCPQALDAQTSIATTSVISVDQINGNMELLNLSSTTGLGIGMSVTGASIPTNTYITAIESATSVRISKAVTASINGNSVTFGIPSTWLATAADDGLNTTAYRVMWVITDVNNNLIQGAPSQIAQVSNKTASEAAVLVNFTIPPGITTSHKYQIYRAAAVANGITPNDEDGLVYEGSVSSTVITYGQVSVLDIVPDALRGATIYTAPSQQGIANANVALPFAYDLAVFRGCMFYGNTYTAQTYLLTLLGTGSPAGIQSGDTVTIAGITYTAGSSEDISTRTFAVSSVFTSSGVTCTTNSSTSLTSVSSMTGIAVGQAVIGDHIPDGTFVTALPGGSTVTISQAATNSAAGESVTFVGNSAAQAIRDTSLSLVRVINRATASLVYAYYISGPNDLPGQMAFQARTLSASTFYLISSRATCWSPSLPTSGTTQASNGQVNPNYIYCSKQNQPESVPAGSYFPVGSADRTVLRIIALRDALFILKQDGIYYLTGTDPTNFQVWPLDYTTNVISAESAVALNNQIYCLTTQGIVAITQNGVSIMSRPIEGVFLNLIAENYDSLRTTSFGVAYESSRAYYIFCVSGEGETTPTQYYRYNYLTNTWVHSDMSKTCGAVNPTDDKLYLGDADLPIIDVENKTLTYRDYADYASTQTISDVDGVTVTISSADTISVGSIIFQSVDVFGIVESVDAVAGEVTTTLPTELVPGAADVLNPISTEMSWVPMTFGNPGWSKQFREATPLFLADFYGDATLGFSSDVYPAVYNETITGGNVGAWGLSAWGGPDETSLGTPWGGNPRRRPIRVSVDRNHQRCSLLNIIFSHSYGYSGWALQGISLVGNNLSERTDN